MKNTYLTSLKAFALAMLVAATAALSSCGDDDGSDPDPDPDPDPITQSILEIINENADGDLDSLKKYLNIYPSLTGALGADGTYTMFAPTNAAFISLLQTPNFPQDISQINPDIIEGVLAYHVVAGSEVTSDQFTAGNELATLYTDPLTQVNQVIDFNEDGTILTGSTTTNIMVDEADIGATNGIMHKTASVLIPPSVGATLTPILGTNGGSLLLGADFTTLATGIFLADAYAESADLPTITETLIGSTLHTVFAPTNATFESESFPIDVSTLTAEQWYGILLNHVVLDVVAQEDMVNLATLTSALGQTLLVIEGTPTNGTGIFIDSDGNFDPANAAATLNAEVALFNAVDNDNGTIHVIAGLLSPPQ